MRKLLLLLLALCLSWQVKAQTYTIDATTGNLSNAIATANSQNPSKVVIKGGPLNADDLKAIASLSTATSVVMADATLTDEAIALSGSLGSNSKIESIVLPANMYEVNSDWFSGFSRLGTALSYTTNGKSLKAYCKKENTLATALNALSGVTVTNSMTGFSLNGTTPVFTNNLEEVVISGRIVKNDIAYSWGAGLTNATGIKHYDLSKATLVPDDNSDNNPLKAINPYGSPNNTVEEINLPENLTSIPQNAFKNLKALQYIYIPNTVTYIGDEAFRECSSIQEVEFQKGLTSLNFGNRVFYKCEAMKHIVIPEGVQNIGKNMFEQCSSLESLRLPNTLTIIDEGAFKEAKALTYLTIPKNVESIGSGAFENSGLRDIYLMAESPDKLPKIYSTFSAYPNSSSFGANSVNGNNSFPKPADFRKYLKTLADRGKVEGHPEMTGADVDAIPNTLAGEKTILSFLTSEQVEEVYRNVMTGGNTITAIHYVNNEAMNNFLNANPWKGNLSASDIALIQSNNGHYNDGAGNQMAETMRYNTADNINDAYGYGPDKFGKYWPDRDHADYEMRKKMGNPSDAINASNPYNTGAEPSVIGWRQFILCTGFSPDNTDEVFTKEYDDTWYTMCFPFDLTDEQLEGAFNPKYNICEFAGAAIETTQEEIENENYEVENLVLLFTNIATTYYRDKYGNYYIRTKDANGNKEYTPATPSLQPNGSISLTPTPGGRKLTNDDNDPDKDIYQSIKGYLAQAGHPYMIHPQKVESLDGHASQCVINHIQYKYDWNKLTGEELAIATENIRLLYENEAVTRQLSRIKEGEVTEGTEGNYDVINLASGKVNLEPVAGAGSYTFKGTYKGPGEEELIPYGAYFLAVDPNGDAITRKYPQFYRETGPDNRTTGYWRQYTAIILADDAAQAWEKEHLEGPYQASNAFSMGFGEFEEVSTDEIGQIVDEALRENLPVKQLNVIVNINGQVVREGLDMTGLPRGIYIVNGKKYMVK